MRISDWSSDVCSSDLATGFVTGCVWAFIFNAGLGAQMGVFYYGRVIGGLAIFEGTKHQYPLYDTLAMGIQMMLFSYLLGRTDSQERSVIEIWADSRATTRLGSSLLSIVRSEEHTSELQSLMRISY